MKILTKSYLEKVFPLEHVKLAFSLKHIAKGHKYRVSTIDDYDLKE